jgi:transcriptional regulator GlxA family with amidase domain
LDVRRGLARRFPDIFIEPDRLVIDDGYIITAGAVLAWADLGLSLVERLLGPSAILATAHFMLLDPSGREQRFYSGFAPRLQHGDRAILAIQHWLQTQASQPVTVSALADRAGLGERTFLRRFIKATGVKPTEYHQRLRVARTRELLELTSDTIEQIAVAVGYEDAGGYRRTFKRIMGLARRVSAALWEVGRLAPTPPAIPTLKSHRQSE